MVSTHALRRKIHASRRSARTALGALVLALGAASAAAQVVSRPLSPSPAPRSAHAMTYDATSKVTLLYGGSGDTLFRDLWSWDGRAWRRLSSTGPAARDDVILAHAADRRRTVLFGGRGSDGQLFADTWEWDGVLWSRRSTRGPGGRMHAAGAYDPLARRLRVFGGTAEDERTLSDTWEWDGTSWTRVATRGAAAGFLPNRMAFDPVRRRTLLSVFSVDERGDERGADGTYATALWEWSGDQWRVLGGPGPSLSPIQDMSAGNAGGLVLHDGGVLQGVASTWTFDKRGWTGVSGLGPAPRNGHALATDFGRGRTVLFGGFRGSLAFDDTWEWDGSTWTRVVPGTVGATRLEQRFAAAVAFDSARGALVVAGGEAAGRRFRGDTWEWDGRRWARVANSGPGARYWASMAFDPLRRRCVLFGGTDGSGILRDTWEWDGTRWTRVSTTGPSPRYAHELAWDPVRGEVVLFGGRDANAVRGDTWSWNGTRWLALAGAGPSARFTHGFAHDPVRRALVVVAGHGPGPGGALQSLADAWALDASGWRAVAAPGSGALDHVSCAFDLARGRLVALHAGPGSGPRLFEWDGSAWHGFDGALADVNGGHRLVYDTVRARVLLWTGVPGSETESRLLAWDGERWIRADP